MSLLAPPVNYTSGCGLLGRLKVEGSHGVDVVDVRTRPATTSRTFVDDQLLRHKSVIDIEDRIAVSLPMPRVSLALGLAQ